MMKSKSLKFLTLKILSRLLIMLNQTIQRNHMQNIYFTRKMIYYIRDFNIEKTLYIGGAVFVAGSVIAIKNGFLYQGFYFWMKALELLEPDSNILSVCYEFDGIETKSFDDIVIEYRNDVFTSSGSIKKRCYQVKFHQQNTQTIGFKDLMDPSFINATSKSFLQKAKETVESSQDEVEITLINCWNLDQKDVLYEIISNDDGGINTELLKKGTTRRSKYSNARISWQDHLEINEDELFSLLKKIKIIQGKPIISLIADLNIILKSNGLKQIDCDNYRESKYLSLLDDIHAKSKATVRFNAASLRENLSKKGLFLPEKKSGTMKLGIKSYTLGAENLHNQVDKLLDLSHYFLEKRLCDSGIWNEKVKSEIEKFVNEEIESTKEYSVFLEAHQSVAFTLGYFTHQKTGKKLYPIQKGLLTEIWKYSSECMISEENELEIHSSNTENCDFIIVNIDLMNRGLKKDIREYVLEEYSSFQVGIVDVFPIEPSQRFVIDGNHCMKLAIETSTLLSNLPLRVKRKKWLFAFTAPNTYVLFLGQNSTQFGKIQLLEFDRDELTYKESISF